MGLAWLVPGGGHLYLGRKTRASVFAGVVIFMFVIGLMLDGKLYVYEPGRPLTFLAMLGSLGAGIPYFVARVIGAVGDAGSGTYEYGTAFTLTSGLMNLLLILDVWDVAEGRKE